MPWFRVDDGFHSHPKVLATEPAALGLWVVAGSWSSAHLTDGFIPDNVLPWLLPDSVKLAETLVTSGLWRRRKGGYQFHDWSHKNPTRTAVEKARKTNAARQRRWQDAQRNGVSNSVTDTVTNSAPALPSPSISTGLYQRGRHARPREDKPSSNGTNINPGDGAAARHPSARPLAAALEDAHLNGTPIRGDAVASIAALARQAITREDTDGT